MTNERSILHRSPSNYPRLNMPWTTAEHARNTFTRPLGPNEVFIKLVSDPGHPLGREHWAINYTATISPRGAFAALSGSPDLLSTLIRYSWLHLRFQHPSLAAHPDSSNSNVIYTVPDSADALSEWASQTFTVEADARFANEVIPTIAPAADARLYYVPQSSELLLHTAHWRMDGVGGLLLLGQLVDLIVSHADTLLSGKLLDPFDSFHWGSEVARLAPPVEEAGNMPLTATDEQKAVAHWAVGTFALAAGALGVPYTGDASTVPSGTRAAELTFSPATTSAAVSAAKARGVGITAAVHASLAAVNFRHAIAEHQGRHYTSTIKQSLRPYLPEPYSTPAAAAGLYTSGWLVRVDASGTWVQNARMYQAEYQKGISKEYLQAHREYASTLVEVIKNLPTPTEPPSDIDISSMGIMEKYLEREYGTPERGFGITHAGVGVEMLSRQGVVFVWTFRDQLTLRLVYNEAFHTPRQMTEFLRDIQADLLKQLQVAE
ncbi:uncharacterized protein N7446_010196 [Penicillium canescens]|uniref:Uncharacterized protein n=1 Tax=Penicillium canescens TaxID=5083 RepID=A0AAD6I841_PENCN|nr:uncharacterized protein N7446_010196 [Penicillium canescens]KAJ6035434.1 hypothetical protein N7460_009609 [Penicillium canescens]KAJ6037559.1 hypothetical protein N7444_010264 [Penicillium canescens]KAJ6054184.1 hypothetical protein N7446_010196 [Penicillium canescens]